MIRSIAHCLLLSYVSPKKNTASLKSGVVLCELINTLFPNSVPKINQGAMPFVQRENIVAYINACKKQGQRETDCFVTQDLFEGSNMAQVIDQITSLGHLASTKGWRGAQLVISGGAVQVASAGSRVASAAPAQVTLTQPKYQPATTFAGASKSYNQAPSAAPPAPAKSSFSPSSPAAAASPKPASSPAGGPKFCGNCGKPRTDMGAKFCGECGTKIQ